VNKFFLLILALTLTALACAPLQGAPQVGGQLRNDIDFAKEKVYPALVNIQVVAQSFSGGRSRKAPGAGSGVIVSPDGHVLTNFHVAGDTVRIVCHLSSSEAINADVVAHDPLTDISVLKLKLEEREDQTLPLPYSTLGDSDALTVGDYVLAMGNPMSLSNSTTLGIVSNKNRVFTTFTGTDIDSMELDSGHSTGMFTRWIQHDALILPGNSGGPLVNLRGEVIGINELGGSGMSFAIPSNLASQVLTQALTSGEVKRGWFGLSVYPVSKMKLKEGALVTFVVSGGPADVAGVQAGDLILAMNNEPVNVTIFEDVPLFYLRMADQSAGDKVPLKIRRDGQEKELTINVKPMEKYLGEEEQFQKLGITAREITGPMALMRQYPDTKGVKITGVRPGRPADEAKPKLAVNDVLCTINGKVIEDIESFDALVTANKKSKEMVITFRRIGEELITVLDLSKDDSSAGGGKLPKAWMGMKTQVLTKDVAKALNLEGKKGFRFTQVYPETEIEKAGVKAGDVITHMNGSKLKAYRVQDYERLTRKVENLTINTTAKLTVLRDGEEIELEVLLEETPSSSSDAETAKSSFLEFNVRDLTFMDRIKRKWSRDQKGVLVTGATMGGWSHIAGLQGGDLILTIMDKEVKEIESFKKVMKKLYKEQPKVIKLFLRRSFRTAFVFIEPDWTKFEEDEK